MRHAGLFLAVALTGAGADLLSKGLAFRGADLVYDRERGYSSVRNPKEVRIVESFLSYDQATNPGVAFSGFQGAPRLWTWVSLLAVPLIVGIFLRTKQPRWILTLCLGMILAGTLGNLFDRLAYGAVRDFIKFYVVLDGQLRVWPLFNLADSYICVGVFLLAIEGICFRDRKVNPPGQSTRLAPASPPA